LGLDEDVIYFVAVKIESSHSEFLKLNLYDIKYLSHRDKICVILLLLLLRSKKVELTAHLSNTSSWCGALFSTRDRFTSLLTEKKLLIQKLHMTCISAAFILPWNLYLQEADVSLVAGIFFLS
jgi:hypothetical protein